MTTRMFVRPLDELRCSFGLNKSCFSYYPMSIQILFLMLCDAFHLYLCHLPLSIAQCGVIKVDYLFIFSTKRYLLKLVLDKLDFSFAVFTPTT